MNVNATLGKKFSFTFYQLNHKKNVSILKSLFCLNKILKKNKSKLKHMDMIYNIWYGKLLNAMHCIQAAVAWCVHDQWQYYSSKFTNLRFS